MSNNNTDPASMNATRSSSKTAPPTPRRDGFHLVPSHPIKYELDQSSTFEDITYHISTTDHVARIAFNRPHVLHAFRPTTINEIRRALEYAQDDTRVSVIILTSNTVADRTPAFCAGGDQTVRSSDGGYDDESESAPRLRVLDYRYKCDNVQSQTYVGGGFVKSNPSPFSGGGGAGGGGFGSTSNSNPFGAPRR